MRSCAVGLGANSHRYGRSAIPHHLGGSPQIHHLKGGNAAAVGEVLGAVGDVVTGLTGAALQHDLGKRKLELERDLAEGKTALEAARNKLREYGTNMEAVVREMLHKRYWDFSDYGIPELRLSRFGFDNKEEYRDAGWTNHPKHANKEQADQALTDYINKQKADAKAEIKEAQAQIEQAKKDMREYEKEMRELESDLKIKEMKAKAQLGSGAGGIEVERQRHRPIKRTYPDPSMMANSYAS